MARHFCCVEASSADAADEAPLEPELPPVVGELLEPVVEPLVDSVVVEDEELVVVVEDEELLETEGRGPFRARTCLAPLTAIVVSTRHW